MKKILSITIVCWSLLIFASLTWNYKSTIKQQQGLVLHSARSFFQFVVVSRSWNAQHGGVYVPVTDETRPNKYLKDPMRDLSFNEYLKLTKINPAFMTRQLSEIAKQKEGVQFHITSLNPIRPENKPTAREAMVLESFEKGNKETGEFITDKNSSYFFYMAPLITEKACLKCHAAQGYIEGSVRGGISVYLPYENDPPVLGLFVTHFSIFLVGIILIIAFGNKLGSAYEMIKSQATLDALTGIPNRRAFSEELLKQFHSAKRDKCPLSLLMCDVDNFKIFNDTYGHMAGDKCLNKVAKIIDNSLGRPCDFCARYGGEEFVVILPNTSQEGAIYIAEKIRGNVSSENIEHNKSLPAKIVTISIGVATIYVNSSASHEELIIAADNALYNAKESGRNCVTVAPSPS